MGYFDEEEYGFEPSVVDLIVEEYKDKCFDLLKQSVKDNLAAVGIENDNLKLTNEKLLKTNRELSSKVYDFEKEKEKYAKEMIESYKRKCSYGVLPEDYVWIIKEQKETEKCKYCGGTHKIKVVVIDKEEAFNCPKCNYNGEITVSKNFIPIKAKVKEVGFTIWNERKNYSLKLVLYTPYSGDREKASESIESYSNGKLSRDFWLTEEECRAECNKMILEYLNKKEN